MKICTWRILHAVVRPQRLLSITQLNLIERPFSGMLRRKRSVMLGMPVLGEDYMLKAWSQLVNRCNNGISVCDCKPATKAKVALHINYEQYIVLPHC
jgi:hypothetical protein